MEAGVHRAPADEVRSSQDAYRGSGWQVFVIPDGIHSKDRFFERAIATFPLDPPVGVMGDSWDALADSLLGGLHDLPDARVAVLWPDALSLADADPAAYEVALSVLCGLTKDLADPDLKDGPPTTLAVAIGT